MCEFDWSTFWSAVGALATTAATLVALWLPQRMDEKARARAVAERAQEQHEDVSEVSRAVHATLEGFFILRTLLQPSDPNQSSFGRISSIRTGSWHNRATLEVLARRDGLTDGVVAIGTAGASLAEAITNIAWHSRQGTIAWKEAQGQLQGQVAFARALHDRAKRVAAYHKIPVTTADFQVFDIHFASLPADQD